MSDQARTAMPLRSMDRHPDLVVAAVYERVIEAAIESVWDNVFDWEHLPWLHDQAFSSIELRENGEWGWHADVGMTGGVRAEIELVADRAASHYVARTRSGAGTPGEIWTTLTPAGVERTEIRVEFCTNALPEDDLARVGHAYRAVYQGLWDQDEEMMRVREDALKARASRGAERSVSEPVDLGSWDSLRERLPIEVEFGGHRFRVVEQEGQPLAHALECPHWLGPLDDCPVEAGIVTCPWHGYTFDVAKGESADGRGLRLRRAPHIDVDPATGRVRLSRADAAASGENHDGV